MRFLLPWVSGRCGCLRLSRSPLAHGVTCGSSETPCSASGWPSEWLGSPFAGRGRSIWSSEPLRWSAHPTASSTKAPCWPQWLVSFCLVQPTGWIGGRGARRLIERSCDKDMAATPFPTSPRHGEPISVDKTPAALICRYIPMFSPDLPPENGDKSESSFFDPLASKADRIRQQALVSSGIRRKSSGPQIHEHQLVVYFTSRRPIWAACRSVYRVAWNIGLSVATHWARAEAVCLRSPQMPTLARPHG